MADELVEGGDEFWEIVERLDVPAVEVDPARAWHELREAWIDVLGEDERR